MDTTLLEEIGLTQREIKVYLALLEIGPTSVGEIIKKSGIPSSKIYEILDKLIKKGLVSFLVKEHKRYYRASEPKIILDFLEEKKDLIKYKLLPKLEDLYNIIKKEKEATIYEGIKGVKAVYERMLKELNRKEILYVLGAPSKANELLETYFTHFHKRRIESGIKMKILYYPEARKYGKLRKKMKLTEVRYMPEDIIIPAWIDIFAENIAIFNLEDIPTVFLIKDRYISYSFKTYFDMIWKSTKK